MTSLLNPRLKKNSVVPFSSSFFRGLVMRSGWDIWSYVFSHLVSEYLDWHAALFTIGGRAKRKGGKVICSWFVPRPTKATNPPTRWISHPLECRQSLLVRVVSTGLEPLLRWLSVTRNPTARVKKEQKGVSSLVAPPPPIKYASIS